jgi:hypothetical protein
MKRADRVAVRQGLEGAKLERAAQVAEGNARWNRRTGFGQLRGNARHRPIRYGQKNYVR